MNAWSEISTALPPMDDSPPRHGRIRLGEKYVDAGGNDNRRALDHFVVHSDDNGTTLPAAAEAFHRIYPGEPRSLRAWLPGEKPESVFNAAWRLYGTRKIKRKCSGPPSAGGTGQAVQRLTDGTVQACECQCDQLPEKSKLRCTFGWELLLLLPDVSAGVWDIVSGSQIGWQRIAAELQHAYALAGSLHLLEVDVVLVPTHVTPPGEASKTVWTVSVRPTGSARVLVEGGGRFSIEAARDAGAIAASTVVPDRYALPPSGLDEQPDELLHPDELPRAAANLAAGSDPSPPASPAATTPQPATQTAGESSAVAGGEGPTLADQLRAMTEADRRELRERIPIADGAKATEVTELLGEVWSRDLMSLLRELRRRDCTFEELGLADPWKSLVEALEKMSKDDRGELRRRCAPIFDDRFEPDVVEVLGLRWSLDLPGLLNELRARDCTFGELEEKTAAAVDKFEQDVVNDTLGPTDSQLRAAEAALPAVGEQASMYGKDAPS